MFIDKIINFLILFYSSIFVTSIAYAVEEVTSPIQFSGLIESEAGVAIIQEVETTTESDFALATVEFGADAQLSDNVLAHLLLLYEEGENDDNIAVDEGSIALKNIYGTPLAITFGRLCAPFGEFNSHFVSDPFTLEIAETGKTALQIGIEHQIFAGSLALFKSGVVAAGEENNHLNNISACIAITPTEEMLGEGISISVGASFIKNLADTDGIGDVTGFDADKLDDIPLGLGAFTSVGLSGVFLEGEFIAALGDLSGKTATGATFESKPWTLNTEIGYSLEGLPIPIEVAAKFERLHQDEDTNVERFGGVISAGLFDETAGIAAEFLRTDVGDGSENTLTFQLSAEF